MSNERRGARDEELIERLRALRAVEPGPEFSARLLSDLERRLARRAPAPRAGPLRLPALRLAAALVLVLALGTQQVLAAPASSPLYETRVALEHLSIAVDPRAEEREARLAALIRERQAEVARLEAAGALEGAARVRGARRSAEALYASIVGPLSSQGEPAPIQAPEDPEATAAPAAPEAGETLFAGRLVRADGSAVVGACVAIGAARCAATSDEDGSFALSVAIAPGAELPVVVYDARGAVLGSAQFVSQGEEVQLLGSIVLQQAAPPVAMTPPPAPTEAAQAVTVSVSGRAVRIGGASAADACVRLAAQTDCATRTAADGAFRLKVTGRPGSGVALLITLRTALGLSTAAHVFTLPAGGEHSIGTLTLIP